MANLNNDRIVVLIDMDCFFCQVETKLQPEYANKPLAVVQYNQWRLGGIIAVNYEARRYGVTRHMRGEEAKQKCPDLILASVPCLRGKADTSRYRSAGREVIDVIKKYCSIIERASVDEAYLDITEIVAKRMSVNALSKEYLVKQLTNTFVVGYSEIGKNDEEERSKGISTWLTNILEDFKDVQAQKLALAGVIVEELRSHIFKETGFRCSAGIAHNKILAKLACGLHKPNRQTILPPNTVSTLYSTLPIKKVRNLGGKFGDVVIESLNCNVMSDLFQFSLEYLQKRFDDKTGLWLYNIARGVDNEPVTMRLVSKSIGACKKFPGKQAITSLDVLKHWAGELSAEICERLEQDLQENERRATLLTVCYHYYQSKVVVSQSRSCTLNSYKPEKMAMRCVEIISKSTQCPIAYLGISAGKFIPAKYNENLMKFFKLGKVPYTLKAIPESVNTVGNFIETTSNLQSNEIVSNLKTDKIKIESSNQVKRITQNFQNGAQLNVQQIFNEREENSPTSSKLNHLIKSLKNQNKKNLNKKKSNSYNFTNSLDQANFKESFFMNTFNVEGIKLKDTYINEEKNTTFGCKHLNTINIQKNEDDSNNTLNFKAKESNVATINENEKEQSSSNIKPSNSNNNNNVQNTITLKEIFPDLNNIDLNVLALLPLYLQEEAKLYTKTQSKKKDNPTQIIKNTKGKGRSKLNISKVKRDSDIYSFLVKKESTNLVEIPSKQCTQCCQMIPLLKYHEHCDFHVAENLQKELNSGMLQSVNVKRKNNANDINAHSMKRRSNEDTLQSDTNHKLTSFLS